MSLGLYTRILSRGLNVRRLSAARDCKPLLSFRSYSQLTLEARLTGSAGNPKDALLSKSVIAPVGTVQVQGNTFASSASPQQKDLSEIEANKVVPDVVDTVPKQKLVVKYGSKVVDLGNILTRAQVREIPAVTYDASPGKFYTLVMTAPDRHSRADPKFAERLHWLVMNIPGNDVQKGETLYEYVGSDPPKGSCPSLRRHRYVFLVYEQPGKLKIEYTFRLITDPSGNNGLITTVGFTTNPCGDHVELFNPRFSTDPSGDRGELFTPVKFATNSSEHHGEWFTIRKFAAKCNLGQPIAGNFYRTRYVPVPTDMDVLIILILMLLPIEDYLPPSPLWPPSEWDGYYLLFKETAYLF